MKYVGANYAVNALTMAKALLFLFIPERQIAIKMS